MNICIDDFDKKIYDKIKEQKRGKKAVDYIEIYKNFYGVDVGFDTAKKRLRAIEIHIDRKYEQLEDEELKSDAEKAEGVALNDGIDALKEFIKKEKLKYKESVEMSQNGTYKSDRLLYMNVDQMKDPKYLLAAHGFDDGAWQIVSARNNIWNVYSKQDGVSQLYSSKVTCKPIVPEFRQEWMQQAIDNLDYTNRPKAKIREISEDGVTVEINFCDVHIGKYITALIANGNYNADIAIERFRKGIVEALSAVSHYKVKKFMFIVGQDYINVDNLQGTTTKGTRQDMNEFYQTIYEKAFTLIIESIERLRDVAPVEAVYVKGNHDKLSTYTMMYGIKNLYAKCDDVTIDHSIRQRKYKVYGNTLVGYGHGEEEKSRIFDCMQKDVKEYWHKEHKYFHLSHFHSEKSKEKGGVVYCWLGSLSEECIWTYNAGFGSEKKGHIFVYDDNHGKIAEYLVKA